MSNKHIKILNLQHYFNDVRKLSYISINKDMTHVQHLEERIKKIFLIENSFCLMIDNVLIPSCEDITIIQNITSDKIDVVPIPGEEKCNIKKRRKLSEISDIIIESSGDVYPIEPPRKKKKKCKDKIKHREYTRDISDTEGRRLVEMTVMKDKNLKKSPYKLPVDAGEFTTKETVSSDTISEKNNIEVVEKKKKRRKNVPVDASTVSENLKDGNTSRKISEKKVPKEDVPQIQEIIDVNLTDMEAIDTAVDYTNDKVAEHRNNISVDANTESHNFTDKETSEKKVAKEEDVLLIQENIVNNLENMEANDAGVYYLNDRLSQSHFKLNGLKTLTQDVLNPTVNYFNEKTTNDFNETTTTEEPAETGYTVYGITKEQTAKINEYARKTLSTIDTSVNMSHNAFITKRKRKRTRRRTKGKQSPVMETFSMPTTPAPVNINQEKYNSTHIKFNSEESEGDLSIITISTINKENETMSGAMNEAIKPRIIQAINKASNGKLATDVSPHEDDNSCTCKFNPLDHPKQEVIPIKDQIVAFKILKMSDNYEPHISDYIIGIVTSVLNNEDLLIYILAGRDECQKPNGKFDLDLEDNEKESHVEQEEFVFNWKDMLEVKSVSKLQCFQTSHKVYNPKPIHT